jgi:signal transduction histidine kinase
LGYDQESLGRWTRYAPDRGTPSGVVALTGEAIYLESEAVWRVAFPGWVEWIAQHGVEGYAAVPIRLHDRVLGVLALTFPSAHAFTADDRDALAGFVAQAGQAFERARLYREAIEARREAERARAEAELANHAKSAFLATMSHELRTPLNAIGGYVDLIEMGIRGPVTDAQLDDLTRIRRSQKHLLGLINDVLNFAKLGAGAIRYDLQDVGVSVALSMAEIMVAPQISAKGLRFAVVPAPTGTTVRADPEKLQQILLNLLSNAVKFTDRGGELTVTCEPRADDVALHVRDTGCGIPPDKLGQIFEPFVQIDRHFSRPSEGVGLGLAISRELARGMGGDLTVASVLDAGSTFTLTLPRAG